MEMVKAKRFVHNIAHYWLESQNQSKPLINNLFKYFILWLNYHIDTYSFNWTLIQRTDIFIGKIWNVC